MYSFRQIWELDGIYTKGMSGRDWSSYHAELATLLIHFLFISSFTPAVVDILLSVHNSETWAQALVRHIPSRKNYTLRREHLGESQASR